MSLESSIRNLYKRNQLSERGIITKATQDFLQETIALQQSKGLTDKEIAESVQKEMRAKLIGNKYSSLKEKSLIQNIQSKIYQFLHQCPSAAPGTISEGNTLASLKAELRDIFQAKDDFEELFEILNGVVDGLMSLNMRGQDKGLYQIAYDLLVKWEGARPNASKLYNDLVSLLGKF